MDEAKKECLKTPPTVPNSEEGQALNSKMPMSSSTSPSPQSLNTGRSLPRRIINKIPLDFKKLEDAGLHRKLAVALSKQNVLATKSIASETTKAPQSNSAISSAAAPTKTTTPATHTQMHIQGLQQTEHQTGI